MRSLTVRAVLTMFSVVAAVCLLVAAATEAPTGFDNTTNGFTVQVQYDADRVSFEERFTASAGLGPVYDGTSCTDCHQNPTTGGNSQVSNLRAGHFDGTLFADHPGGSLIQDRAIDAAIQEQVQSGNETRSLRMATMLLGAGFIEAIDDTTLQAIANAQPGQSANKIAGQLVQVPVLEVSEQTRAGRFGWKDQHASLVSMVAAEYLDQIGITSPLHPAENTSNGLSVSAFDPVPDPESPATPENPYGERVGAAVQFLRATKAPPRDATLAATADAQAGSTLFNGIGCKICHAPDIVTAPAGTLINGGTFAIPAALGDQTIHPFSDFLLHDVGTPEGIVQSDGQTTRNKVRTPPLWGLRARARFMHHGLAFSLEEALGQHAAEATDVIRRYKRLTTTEKNQLLVFLKSL